MSRNTRHALFTAATRLVHQVIDANPTDAPGDLARVAVLRGKPGYTQAVRRYVARHDVMFGLGYVLLGEWVTLADEPANVPLTFGYFIWKAR